MKFRLSFFPALEVLGVGGQKTVFYREYTTYALAKEHLDLIADYTLHLHSSELMPDYSNIGIIDKWDDDEWIEIED